MGKSVVFVRGLALLKVKRSVDIGGFYAKRWPRYLEEKIGLKPVNKDDVPGSLWEGLLRNYHPTLTQKKTSSNSISVSGSEHPLFQSEP